MIADDLKKDMKIKYNGFAHYVLAVMSPDPSKKDGTPKICKFQLRTRLGHHGTTIQVDMPFYTKVEPLYPTVDRGGRHDPLVVDYKKIGTLDKHRANHMHDLDGTCVKNRWWREDGFCHADV